LIDHAGQFWLVFFVLGIAKVRTDILLLPLVRMLDQFVEAPHFKKIVCAKAAAELPICVALSL